MTTWTHMITLWQSEMIAANVAHGSIKVKISYLWRWARVCPTPGAATHEALIAWISAGVWSPETKRSAVSSLRTFYRWAHKRNLLPHNPAADLPSVRVPIGVPRPADDDDIRRAMQDSSKRVRLMVATMAMGGLRRAETAAIHTSDLDSCDELLVTGKGGRQRWVPLPPELASIIRAQGDGWLFPSRSPATHLTADRVGHLVSRALPEGVTPHQLRHAAATAWHDDGGVSMFELRDLLGHATVTTTQRYVRVRNRAAAAAVRRAARRLPIAS